MKLGIEQPAPILALTVLDARTLTDAGRVHDESHVLLAVRDPVSNKTHPNIISVPTQRIPQSMFGALMTSGISQTPLDATTKLFHQMPTSSVSCNGHFNIIFAVNSLLATKMGVSDFLERKEILYSAYLSALVSGTVFHDDNSEVTAMLNILVLIEKGAHLFPTRTASYSHIMWRPVTTFLNTAREKNPLLLDSNLDPFEYCIHGLCIKSAFNVLANSIGHPLYPSNYN